MAAPLNMARQTQFKVMLSPEALAQVNGLAVAVGVKTPNELAALWVTLFARIPEAKQFEAMAIIRGYAPPPRLSRRPPQAPTSTPPPPR